MEAEFQESFGFLENEVVVVMSRDELSQMRVMVSLAIFHLHPSHTKIADAFLDATEPGA